MASSAARKVGKAAGNRGKGRPKGVPNKSTALAREAIAQLVDGNAHRLEGWLNDIAADPEHGPAVAWRCMMDVLEYHIPKLQRTDVNLTGSIQLGGIRPDDQESPA